MDGTMPNDLLRFTYCINTAYWIVMIVFFHKKVHSKRIYLVVSRLTSREKGSRPVHCNFWVLKKLENILLHTTEYKIFFKKLYKLIVL